MTPAAQNRRRERSDLRSLRAHIRCQMLGDGPNGQRRTFSGIGTAQPHIICFDINQIPDTRFLVYAAIELRRDVKDILIIFVRHRFAVIQKVACESDWVP